MRNVAITGLSKGHISVLLEARVAWSGVLVVLYVFMHADMTLTRSKVKVRMSRSRGYDRQPLPGQFLAVHLKFLSHKWYRDGAGNTVEENSR